MSGPVEGCEKLGTFYPPTQCNLEAYDKIHNEQNKLRKICYDLEGGLMVFLKQTEAVEMPSGCLHAFTTAAKGWMVTASFMTTRTVQGMSSWIAYNPSAVEGEDKENLIGTWILAAELALHSRRSEAALSGWTKVRSRMLHWVERRPVQRHRLRELWTEFLSSPHWDKLDHQVQEHYGVVLASDIEQLEERLTDKRRVAREAMVTR